MFFKKKEFEIVSPMKGRLIRIKDVPDDTFREEMIGKGVATTVFPTAHAIGLTTKDGIDLLIHIGLDTVNLKGEGFAVKVQTGDEVQAGDLLLVADFEKIRQAGYRLESPLIICNPEECKKIVYSEPSSVNPGDVVMKFLK